MPTPPATATTTPLSARLLQDTASMFALLSATVRLHILWELTHGDRDVGTLAAATGQSLATVSHHLSKLKLAGVVSAQRQGKRMVYVIAAPDVVAVVRLAMADASNNGPRASARRARGPTGLGIEKPTGGMIS